MPMNTETPHRRHLLIVVIVAALLRMWAVLVLPVDYDEPIYTAAALDYATLLQAGDLGGVIDYSGNREHPPLMKLIYAAAALALGEHADATTVLYVGRAISALCGVLAVAALGWYFGTTAAALFALHTLVVKYTAQAYLEALPLWFMIMVLGVLMRHGDEKVPPAAPARWGVAGVLVGAAAAAKLTYPVLYGSLLLYLLWQARKRWQAIAGFVGAAGLAFALFNPALWHDPLGRLAAQVGFHLTYTQGGDVTAAAYPWFQPIIWLATSAAADWHPEVFFYFGFDGLIFLFTLAGVIAAWRDPARRGLAIGLLGGLVLLLLWPTKWPQYALVLTPLVCILAADTLVRLVRYLRELNDYWGWMAEMLPHPPRYAWIALIVCGLFVGGIYSYGMVSVAMGRVGWMSLPAAQVPLSGGSINAIHAFADGQIVFAGDRGAAIRPANSESGWNIVTEQPVYALTASGNAFWLATATDIHYYTSAGALIADQPLPEIASAGTYALAVDTQGRVYLGSARGAAIREAGTWRNLPLEGPVLAILADASAGDEWIWFGGIGWVAQYHPISNTWTHYAEKDGFGRAGAAQFLRDVRGNLWLATLGDGLARWDGSRWHWFTPANSDLPHATVSTLLEGQPGELWIGTAEAIAGGGGAITRTNGESWYVLLPRNSGYSGAEPLALASDPAQRLWITTRTGDVLYYQQP